MAVHSFAFSFLIIFILCLVSIRLSISSENQEVFIVHMLKSDKPHIFSTHHDWYSSIVLRLSPLSHHSSSKLLYTYDTVVHGFSARLTPSQASELRNIPGVISVLPDRIRQLHTTRSPQFLGLLESSGLWPSSDYGDGVIIGVIDSGIWPEGRRSFSDDGLSPAPFSWKGICEDTTDFPADTLCNNKIIGARTFYQGYEGRYGTIDESKEPKSPRDITGHGTHTASIAAGSSAANAGFFGYAQGEARGIAVKARIAVYKSCWLLGCMDSDILAAMDQAVEDDVRVISVSIGEAGTKQYYDDNIAIGAFGAMQQGVLVSFSASNTGPRESTVENIAPWSLTVGASTIDRQFPADVILGDDTTYTGASLYSGESLGQNQIPVVYGGDAKSTFCYSGELDASIVRGKIVFCEPGGNSDVAKGIAVEKAGGVGMIVPNGAGKGEQLIANDYLLPALNVDETDGNEIRDYIKSDPSPNATIVFRGTVIGTEPSAPRVAASSGRGPNPITSEILKPDVIAPGINILAAWTNATGPSELDTDPRRVEFKIKSGTSMACPHASGLAALLRKVHPKWSPAAIKSALMTTAYTEDDFGNYLIDQSSGAPSNPYIHGSGHINAITASDPGLVYDLEVSDYVDFLCTIGYNTQQISLFVKDSTVDCSTRQLGTPGNLNYPAFSVVYYNDETLVEYNRTVKNVGSEKDIVYRVNVDNPENVQVNVSPIKLEFNKGTDTLSYQVKFTSTSSLEYDTYGSITWEDDDQMHIVTSPIVVRRVTTLQSTL